MHLAARWALPLLVLIGPTISAAEPTEPISESDAAKAVRFTAALESDPLGDDSNEYRQWLLHWLVETPDYTVIVCDILGPLPSQDLPYGPELLVQQMFGNVAFQINNPNVTDKDAFQLAGIESVLTVYSVIFATDSRVQHPFFDDLLAKRNAGKLKDHMMPILESSCASEPET